MTLRLATVRSTGHMTSLRVKSNFLIKPCQSTVVRGSLHVSLFILAQTFTVWDRYVSCFSSFLVIMLSPAGTSTLGSN